MLLTGCLLREAQYLFTLQPILRVNRALCWRSQDAHPCCFRIAPRLKAMTYSIAHRYAYEYSSEVCPLEVPRKMS